MIQLLSNNPLLLLAVVIGLGYLLGRISIAGTSLGVAAVLFAGLIVSSFSPTLKLPVLVYQLGLVLFVYTVGLSSGSAFFASFRRKGLRDSVIVLVLLSGAFGIAYLAATLLHIHAALAVGLFAGSLTNTPALASVLETLHGFAQTKGIDQLLTEPIVGYSITYPMGVIGVLGAIAIMQRVWHIDYAKEASEHHQAGDQPIHACTILVTQPVTEQDTLYHLASLQKWNVAFGRINHDDHLAIINEETVIARGDLISVIGEQEALLDVTNALGEVSETRLDFDRSVIDNRRIAVSNPHIAGHYLEELNLTRQYGAIVTRLRRGDSEFVPQNKTVVQLGDRLRIVAPRQRIEALSALLGDSYRALSEIDIMTFSLGLALGLLLGLVPIPIFGLKITLGIAGGPLIVALILGARNRTGPFLWTLPYNANLTLRQIGLLLFLAGVGTQAGYTFLNTFTKGGGLIILGVGTIITLFVALSMLFVGYRVLKIPMGVLTGMLAGLQTQPAVLGFALEQSGNDLPNVGYAEVYPLATIMKIILAQVLLSLLMR